MSGSFRLARKGASLLLALVAVSCNSAPVARATSGPLQPLCVLFVGNSFTYYNNSLHNHYRKLVHAARGPKWQGSARSMTLSGGHLDEHREGLRQRTPLSCRGTAWNRLTKLRGSAEQPPNTPVGFVPSMPSQCCL